MPRGPAGTMARLMRRMQALGALSSGETASARTSSRVEASREPEGSSLADLVRWAEATADGRPARAALPGWRAPADAGPFGGFVHTLGRDDLGASGEPRITWGALVWEPGRVALEYREVARLPRDLSSARSAWVHELCRDVCTRWTYVRIGLRPDHDLGGAQRGEVVSAEVDLTGAPPALLPRLLDEGREALARVIAEVRPTLGALADRRLESRLLARRPIAERVARSTPDAVSGAVPTRYFQLSFPW